MALAIASLLHLLSSPLAKPYMYLIAKLYSLVKFLDSQHRLGDLLILHERVFFVIFGKEHVNDLPVSREEFEDLLNVGLDMKICTFCKPWMKSLGPTTISGRISNILPFGS